MRKQKLISIIIVNWNGLNWLKGCFPTLARQTYKNTQWILVDNASTDRSVAWTKAHYPKTKIIVNEKNLGFSHANNIGYKQAKGDYILFLNNDTETTPTFLEEFVNVLESDPSIGGAQGKLLLMDDHTRLDSVGAFLTPTGFLYHYGFRQKDSPKYNKQIDLYTAKGACMIFKKDVLQKIEVDGWILDPDYFAYFEETDMCHRVWLSGHRIVYAYKSVVYHKMGATSSGMNNAFVQYHSFKNRINSYCKNVGLYHLMLILPVHLFFCVGVTFALLVTSRYKTSWSIVKAILWNIRNMSSTLRKRKYIQTTIRSVNDRVFWHIIWRNIGLAIFLREFITYI
ncbi:MAG TPA: glycosyltransferase family 2 protein [Patescibacteria group bacterium]|nr:glycosyltransferase family 2 protein [Patescibacteria group bacterium]